MELLRLLTAQITFRSTDMGGVIVAEHKCSDCPASYQSEHILNSGFYHNWKQDCKLPFSPAFRICQAVDLNLRPAVAPPVEESPEKRLERVSINAGKSQCRATGRT
jgi:hypothetical protein